MLLQPPISTLTDTLFPYTALFRSDEKALPALPLSAPFAHSPPSPSIHARSEEHTSELQSLMRISYAVFCLNKKINKKTHPQNRIELQDNQKHEDTAILR